MKLLTKEQRERLLKNGRDQQKVKGTKAEKDFWPVVKLFNPAGAATWLLTELDPEDEDVAWGLCDLGHGLSGIRHGSHQRAGKLPRPVRTWHRARPLLRSQGADLALHRRRQRSRLHRRTGDAMIRRLSDFGFQLRYRYEHLRRAFAYATGRLSCDDAQTIILDCRDYSWLVSADDDRTRRCPRPPRLAFTAIQRLPRLSPISPAACEYVARKWDAGDDCWISRHDWALDTAREFAAQDGIDLDKAEDDPTPNPEGEKDHA